MNKKPFESYTNKELNGFSERLNSGIFLEDDVLFDICTTHFGSQSLINLMMLAVPLCLELSERLSTQ